MNSPKKFVPLPCCTWDAGLKHTKRKLKNVEKVELKMVFGISLKVEHLIFWEKYILFTEMIHFLI